VCLALALVILFHYATRERVSRISRIILPSFLVIILAPLIDLLLSGGQGFNISYMMPGEHTGMLMRFLTFFGPLTEHGITPGMRIEIGLVLLGCFTYFLVKRRSVVRSAVFTFLAYAVIFGYCAMPFLIDAFIGMFGIPFNHINELFIQFYLMAIFVLGIWVAALHSRKHLTEILRDIRPFRLLHFELMFFIGMALSMPMITLRAVTYDMLFSPMLAAVAILFAWLFSVVTNNLADRDIDRVSNRGRPSVTGSIPMAEYSRMPWLFLGLAAAFSWAAGAESLFYILLFAGNYFLYSMPPFRLKRVPFFSKALIALNSLLLMMWGFTLLGVPMAWFPRPIMAFFLIGFTAAINFIDIKDHDGDRKAGIRTLPTIMGLGRSKALIGAFFLVMYPIVYLLFTDALLLPFLLAFGVTEMVLVNRKSYSERPVFAVYIASLVMLLAYVLFL
jgi:4-hydroxybenzoate polyprenyltransferase